MFLLLLPIICAMLVISVFAETAEAEAAPYVSNMYMTFWALVPPIIAIVLALITKEVYSSLFIGIVAGALFHANFNPVKTVDTVVSDGLIKGLTDAWNAGIFLFLILLGIFVALLNKAGGSAAFGRWAEKHIKTRVGAQFATFVLGLLIFVDDYFNCLTVGTVMMPVTDSHRISRSKLAYLIDATAAPVCMIAPISSWAAAVSGLIEGDDGLTLFVKAIPYNLYSLLTFVFIIALVKMNFDYGPMALHEKNAKEKGDLFTSGSKKAGASELDYSEKGRVIDLVFPIVLLVSACVVGIIYIGGFFGGTSFAESFSGTDASVGLPWGALIALVLTFIYLLLRRTITFKDAMDCVTKGFNLMVPSLLILTFAVTLKNMTGLLGASEFVKAMLTGQTPALFNFMPAIIFLLAVFLSFSMGTSWGTFGILLPIIIPVLSFDPELMIIGVSACLAGAICGDHCSPISDTTIMSSAGAGCDHINHVTTQLPYALTVAGVSFVGYVIAAFVRNWFVVFGGSVAILLIVLIALKAKNKEAKADAEVFVSEG